MKHRTFIATVVAVLTAITAVPGIASASQATRTEEARAKSTEASKSTEAVKSTDSPRESAEPGVLLNSDPSNTALANTAPADAALFDNGGLGAVSAASTTPVIGSIDTDWLPPEGIGLVSLPQNGGAPDAGAFPSPSALSGGFGCAISCIEEGLAYPRGFGAELVVETSVPTELMAIVVEITPGYPHVDTTFIYAWDTEHSWVLDDLDPGMSYGVTVMATDEDGNQDVAYGEFTTLSTRNVSIQMGAVEVEGGPSDVTSEDLFLGLDDHDLIEVAPAQIAGPSYADVDGFVDVSLLVRRRFDNGGVCAAAPGLDAGYDLPDQGHIEDSCLVWNTARIDDLDLDVAPVGATRWDSTSFTANLWTPDGAGGSLPDGWADDWWLYVVATATFHVTYS